MPWKHYRKVNPLPPLVVKLPAKLLHGADYLETHAKRLYSSAKDPAMEAARSLLDRIKKGDLQDGFAARDVYRKQWSHLNSSELVHQGTKILADFGWVKEESMDQKGKLIRIHPSMQEKMMNIYRHQSRELTSLTRSYVSDVSSMTQA